MVKGSTPRRRRQNRGLTLVELLVALAVGLIIVGGAASLLLAQLDQQRQRLADARLTLALHVVADLAMREWRRSGHWGRADDGWPAADEPDPSRPTNPHVDLLPPAPATSDADTTTALPAWSYGRASTDHPDLREDHARDNDETGALRLNGTTHAIDLRQSGPQLMPGSGDSWQALSDPQRLRLSRWQVTRRDHVVDLLANCATTRCPDGDPLCPPQRVIRLLRLELIGNDPADPTRTRQLTRQVRVRNDELRGRCPP